MTAGSFQIICEIEPATTPDLTHVRHQIGMMTPVASSFLIPDNHIGRATVSSVAVAHEVQAMGGRAVACLNARDRNLLGFERDLLTAAAYGVDEFLFVYGDKPTVGGRTSELTVRSMLEHARAATSAKPFTGTRPFRLGATTGLKPVPSWKLAADFLFVQVSFSLDRLLAWRETLDTDAAVYAGVMVVASASMARRLASAAPDIHIPDELVQAVESDPDAGVDAAVDLIAGIRSSEAFDGVHLIPVTRYRQLAIRLESA
ncbi:MAG TPA: methylenetetrahydrofolate reductase [Acidimicrobiales bacterium]|jgi:5,10-methylenetetrahydrofolate reductase